MLDEFTEYLLETRVNTSADFDMYPIQIFYISSSFSSFLHLFRPPFINGKASGYRFSFWKKGDLPMFLVT